MSAPVRGASPPQNPANLDVHWGERIGRYQVLTQLSVGGMAELFLGFTSGPGGFRKYVALKRILPDARGDEQFEKMFLDEARITAALNHPNIGQVFELGQDAEGYFLAMEFIAGQNLNQIANVCRRRGQWPPAGFVLSVMRDVCLALHSAHTFTTPGGKPYPVIHRDVAQKNVMVTYDGVVKLLDFGIAKARDGTVRTQAGTVKGTTGYMSPEQVRGEPLDGRSDLFAAGVMLHELLTGERLFSAETEHQEMKMILDAPIPVPTEKVPTVPPEVSAVVLKALARDREQRYVSGREMARALEAAAGGLLFDAEQRAAFMREHFQDRMAMTHRLLESAESVQQPVDSETARMLGGGEGPGDVPTDPSPTLQGARAEKAADRSMARDGARLVERSEAKRPAREQGVRRADTGEPPATGVLTTGRMVTREQPAATETRATLRHTRGGTGKFWVALIALLVVGGGLGFGAVKLVAAIKAQESEGTPIPLPLADLSPMTPILPPGQKKADTADPGPSKQASAQAQPSVEAPPETREAAAKKDDDGEPVRNVRQGALTLVVLPEAEVFLNGRSLGKTPLIKTPLPVGRHLLRIKGADGKRRQLSVPIQAGKTAQFKLKLTDIPER
ncbi:protein kinase domain-containing protein [Archangium lansingense]|uniref:Protein kinase n=1 Tax=Archangium lansingense TaxID=2995310 RepID=A0ABT4AQT6_9BACT|nr:protein kinase [Archangium lansinium]MCY1083631.1 protein kinase [Archangium lansinium]